MNRFMRSGIYVFLASVVVGEVLALSFPAKAPYFESINADPNGAWYIMMSIPFHCDLNHCMSAAPCLQSLQSHQSVQRQDQLLEHGRADEGRRIFRLAGDGAEKCPEEPSPSGIRPDPSGGGLLDEEVRHAHNKTFFSNVISVTDVHALISYYSFHKQFEHPVL
jgi:hypothetical protein